MMLNKVLHSAKRMLNVTRDNTPIIQLFGMPIVVETKKGEKRFPKDDPFPAQYGFIASHLSKEGTELDVIIGDDLTANKAFVFNHYGDDGLFEEHKVCLGFESVEKAKEIYESYYKKEPGKVSVTINVTDLPYFLARLDPFEPLNSKKLKRFNGSMSAELH